MPYSHRKVTAADEWEPARPVQIGGVRMTLWLRGSSIGGRNVE